MCIAWLGSRPLHWGWLLPSQKAHIGCSNLSPWLPAVLEGAHLAVSQTLSNFPIPGTSFHLGAHH